MSDDTAEQAPVTEATRLDLEPISNGESVEFDMKFVDGLPVAAAPLKRLREATQLRSATAILASDETIRAIRELRRALDGLGRVGQHFNAVGQPIEQEVAIVLTPGEVAALTARLTGPPRTD